MIPIFAYWRGSAPGYCEDSLQSWRAINSDFTIYDEDEVAGALAAEFPDFVDTFRAIAIPSPQSDICRFLMLYLYGGLYVDVHFGYDDKAAMLAFLERARGYDLVAIENGGYRGNRAADHLLLISGFLVAKPRHPAILKALRICMDNLRLQRERERSDEMVPYDIWKLCGPWVLNLALFDGIDDRNDPRFYTPPGATLPVLKPEYACRTLIVPEEDLPAKRNRFKSYNVAGSHWSERQAKETLFSQALAPA